MNEQLEERVAERTGELDNTNRILRQTQLTVMKPSVCERSVRWRAASRTTSITRCRRRLSTPPADGAGWRSER